MLQTFVLAGIITAPLGSIALFLPTRRHAKVVGTWPAVRRFVLALVATIALAAIAAGILTALHASEHNLVAAVAGLAFASLVWLPVTRRWSSRAHVCWACSAFLFVVYLTYALEWTFASDLGPASTAGGVLLWCSRCSRPFWRARTSGNCATPWAPSNGSDASRPPPSSPMTISRW